MTLDLRSPLGSMPEPELYESPDRRLAPHGWPVFTVLYGFGIFWALGLTNFIWILASIPMTFSLLVAKNVRFPRGIGIWALFLGWTIPSLALIGPSSRAMVWSYRFFTYLAAGIILVYVYNLPRRRVSEQSAVRALGFYWVLIAMAGLLALLLPSFEFDSPLRAFLPASVLDADFVAEMTRPRLAQIHDFLGFDVARPAAPFVYTNNWGSNMALLAPIMVVWVSRSRGWRRNALLAVAILAVIPVIRSLNRGLWVSLGIGMLYAAIRYAINRKARPLFLLLSFMVVVAVLSIVTPLGELVGERLDEGHSDNRRLSLYSQSIDATLASPLIGHGGPIPDAHDPSGPPVGTHGQIWLLLVSYGLPAAALFTGFLAYLVLRTRRAGSDDFVFWVHIMIVIALVQMSFYFLIPSQLPVLMVAAGFALREIDFRAPV